MSDRIIFPAKRLVVGFPVNRMNVLLSERKRSPWQGKLSGLGGNQEPEDPDSLSALRREALEEAQMEVYQAKKHAQISVIRPGKHTIILDVYLITDFSYCFKETSEMGPHLWLPRRNLPRCRMVEGDSLWLLPIVEEEKCLKGIMYRSSDAERFITMDFDYCSGF